MAKRFEVHQDQDIQEPTVVTSIREIAIKHRLRFYRGVCGDYNISGKYGEIFLYGPGMLAVQIGGPRADRTMTDVPPNSNKRINMVARTFGESHQGGDGEAIFLVPVARIKDAAHAIGARRKRKQSGPPTEAQLRAREAFAARCRNQQDQTKIEVPAAQGGRSHEEVLG